MLYPPPKSFFYENHNTNMQFFFNKYGPNLFCLISTIFLFCPASPTFSQAKRYFVKKIGDGTDLEQACVWSLHLNSRSGLWAATNNGLFRFDGVQVMQFKAQANSRNGQHLAFATADGIAEDEKSRLWVSTSGGLQLIDQFSLDLIPSKEVAFPDTGFYSRVTKICQGLNHTIYLRTNDGIYKYANDKIKLLFRLPGSNSVFYYSALDTALYLLGSNRELYRYKDNTLKWVNYEVVFDVNNIYAPGFSLSKLFFTPLEGIADSIVLTLKPGYVLQIEQKRHGPPVYKTGQPYELQKIFPPFKAVWDFVNKGTTVAQSIIHSFRIVQLKKINDYTWAIGTNRGLYLVTEKDVLFQHLPFTKGHSIRGITEDRQGHLLAGTYSGLLDCTSRKKFPLNYIWDFLPINDHQLWATAEAFMGLQKITRNPDGNYTRIGHPEYTTFKFSKSMAATPKGFWTGSFYEKIFHVDRQSGKFHPSPFNQSVANGHFINSIVFSEEGLLWLGGGKGLQGFRTTSAGDITEKIVVDQIPEDLRSASVNALYLDINKTLWIGTSHSGLFQFKYGSNTPLQHWTTANGLSHNIVYSILGSHSDSILWLGTQKGLCRMEVTTQRFNSYFAEDGLEQDEFNTGARYRSPDGTYYFGGLDGISWFRPERVSIHENSSFGFLQISIVTPKQTSQRFVMPVNGQTLLIQPDETFLVIEFRSNDLVNGQYMICRYRIDPTHQGWRTIRLHEKLTLAGLKPGLYNIEYQIQIQEGKWGQLQKVSIHILAPWYQRNWFIGLCLFVVVLALYLIYKWRINLLQEEFELRQGISNDLHDTLGSRLYLLKSLASKIVDTKDEQKSKELVLHFESQATDATQTIRNFIWAFDPNNNNLQALCQRLEDFTENYLSPLIESVSIHQANISQGLKIDPRTTQHLLNIYQELLTNMIKHTHTTAVEVIFSCQGESFFIDIWNWHKGFKLQGHISEQISIGQKSIANRLDMIGASIVWSEPSEGLQSVQVKVSTA